MELNLSSLKKWSDDDLEELSLVVYIERKEREEKRFKKINACPNCNGSGKIKLPDSSITHPHHKPCKRCKTTGKYVFRRIRILI